MTARRAGRFAARWLLLVCTACASLAGPAAGASRLAAPLTAVAVAGVVPLAVTRNASLLGSPVPDNSRMAVAVLLASRDPAGLQRAIDDVVDPSGDRYHQYLSPSTVQARFGPSPVEVSGFVAWLRSQGLAPRPWSGGRILDVDGTAERFGAAFATDLRLVAPASGRVHPAGSGTAEHVAAAAGNGYSGEDLLFAPDREPSVPARFAALVQTIVGLSGTARAVAVPSLRADALAPTAQGPTAGYDPGRIADAYNFRALYNAGYHGERTRAALVEFTSYDPADIATYARWAGIKPALSDVQVDGGNGSATLNSEATLDIELLSAMAPRASIDVYDAPGNDVTGVSLLDVYSQIAATDVQVVATSWTVCEATAARIPGLVMSEHAIFAQLSLQGTTIVGATGDTGAYACASRSSAGSPSVNLPASDPYVLAVAATELYLGPVVAGRSTYGYEKAWSCAGYVPGCSVSSPKGSGSGGGTSALFFTGDAYGDDLSWEGPLPNGKPGKYRRLPDVSISGSGSDAQYEYSIYVKRQWVVGGGTSASAPVWAALILLADQYLEAHNRPSAGWINPAVYRLGRTLQMLPAYHDVTEGNNLLNPATVGWDYATGWGSPYAWNFTLDLACLEGVCPGGMPSATPTVTVTATPPPVATRTPQARLG